MDLWEIQLLLIVVLAVVLIFWVGAWTSILAIIAIGIHYHRDWRKSR